MAEPESNDVSESAGSLLDSRSVVRPITVFLVVAFAYTWSYKAVYSLVLEPRLAGTPFRLFVPFFSAWGPLIAVVVVLRLHDRNVREWLRSQVRLRNPLKLYLVALLLPNLLQAGRGLVYVWAGVPVEFSFSVPNFVLVFVFTFFLLGSLEEFGWRGYLQPVLQERWGGTPAALAVGLAWGIWHLPALLSGGLGVVHPGFYLVHLLAMSIVMAWLYNAAAGVVPVMAFHAAHNAPGSVVSPVGSAPVGVSELVYPAYALAWVLVGLGWVAFYGTDLGAPTENSRQKASGRPSSRP